MTAAVFNSIPQADVDRFSAYVRSCGPVMMGSALIMCSRRVDAEDGVSEAFQKLWKRFQKDPDVVLDGGIGYALRTLANTVKNQARDRSRRPQEVDWVSAMGDASVPDITASAYLFGEFQRELWAAVSTLDDVQQQIIYLYYVEKYSSLAQVGRQLGLIARTTVRYHDRAIEKLRELIAVPE